MAQWGEDWKPSVHPWGATDHRACGLGRAHTAHASPLPNRPRSMLEHSSTWLPLVPPGKEECDRLPNSLPRTAANKNTQPTLGQLGQAVNGINTSQDATQPNSKGNPLLPMATYSRKTKFSFAIIWQKRYEKRIVHVTEGTQSLQK